MSNNILTSFFKKNEACQLTDIKYNRYQLSINGLNFILNVCKIRDNVCKIYFTDC